MVKRLLISCSLIIIICLSIMMSILQLPHYTTLLPYPMPVQETTLYYSAIDYGMLELKLSYYAEVAPRQEHIIRLPTDVDLKCKVGKVYKGEILYTENNSSTYAEKDIEIFSITFSEDYIAISYYISGEDYIIFYGNKYDYYNIKTGMDVTHLIGTGLHTKIKSSELINESSVFYTEMGNYSNFIGHGFYVDVTIKTIYNCYFIRNEYLSEKNQEGQYILHLLNEYDSDSPLYYDKCITANKFDNEFSVITSGNVSVYEKVLKQESTH